MTTLSIHPEHDAATVVLHTQDRAAIGSALQARGIRFQHPGVIPAAQGLQGSALLEAYGAMIAAEQARHGYTAIDAVSVGAHTPDLPVVRGRFLAEHTHAEDEARFMADGAGTFYLRTGGEVLILELTAGDLISVPEGMRHWFDMGATPRFTAIRFFTRADGWVGAFTGDPIAERFPLYAGAA